MDFRVLGPLEVVEHGRSLQLGSRKQRALLALLLLGAGDVVPRERLVEELWHGEPPPAADATLRAYLSRLRSVLGARLQTRSPASPKLERLANEFISRDSACCPFLEFELDRDGRDLRLEVGGPEKAQRTLDLSFELCRVAQGR